MKKNIQSGIGNQKIENTVKAVKSLVAIVKGRICIQLYCTTVQHWR